jgi:hypothetical protein
MKTKKSWKPMISIIGLILIMMMTAASVCAEDPIARENQLSDEGATTAYTADNESDAEPNLIAPGENEETATSDIPDYQNYTGDMLISPSPEGSSQTQISLDFSILGIIGAVIVIVVVIIGVVLKRK